jgi:hypothetical protein
VVSAVLGELSVRERRLLWQSAVERQPLSEIAAGLRLSYVATAQAVRRARRRAWHIAGRIAVILGLLRLRKLIPQTVPAEPALLLALVPLIAVALPSAAQTQSAPPRASLYGPVSHGPFPTISQGGTRMNRPSNPSGASGLKSVTPALSPVPAGQRLPAITSAVTSVNEAVAEHELDSNRVIQVLSRAIPTPSPLSSIPAPVGTATVLPAH